MGAAEHQVFRQIVLPGALPHVLVGLRLGLARAWRVLVAVEVLTAVPRGLGWLIFGAREFLQADVMLAGIAMIGLVGFLLDRVVFAYLERLTVVRWGMLG
jgi:ABC-type nitrate/sulfonate/bicarbonate transport system permease component